jgi:hypothetical protein
MDGGPSHMCNNNESYILLSEVAEPGDRSLLASIMPFSF